MSSLWTYSGREWAHVCISTDLMYCFGNVPTRHSNRRFLLFPILMAIGNQTTCDLDGEEVTKHNQMVRAVSSRHLTTATLQREALRRFGAVDFCIVHILPFPSWKREYFHTGADLWSTESIKLPAHDSHWKGPVTIKIDKDKEPRRSCHGKSSLCWSHKLHRLLVVFHGWERCEVA